MAAKDLNTLTWHETSPGRYERGIDEAELFYASLAKRWEATGRTHFAITGYVEISLRVSDQDSVIQVESRVETAFRKAWRRIRYDHPALASTIEYDPSSQACQKIYETFIGDENGAKELEWLKNSFFSIRNGESRTQFCNSDPPVHRHVTLYLITPPTQEETTRQDLQIGLVFRCHHNAIDGVGTLMLLKNLLHYASEAYTLQAAYPLIRFGDEHHNLSPPLQIAARIPPWPSPAQITRARQIEAENAFSARTTTDIEDIQILSIPFDTSARVPSKSQRTFISLSSVGTVAMRSHAAAVYHSASGRSLVIDVALPGKSSLMQDRKERQLEAEQEFKTVAMQIKSYYETVRSDPEHLAMVPFYYAAITPPFSSFTSESGITEAAIPPPSPYPSVSLSSMGIVDKIIAPRHGALRVSNPWVATNKLSSGVGVFLATWEGRIELSAGWNTAFHGEAEVGAFLETVRVAVVGGLGLGVEAN